MNLGPWQLDTVSGGRFRLDGGTMFGVVPKSLWEPVQPADELNRIRMATHCVLARDGQHTVLVDTGYGQSSTYADTEIHDLEPGFPLLDSLAALGVTVDEVDTVILSHLHFDHVGGGTFAGDDGRRRTTFPRASYFVQRREWEDATSKSPLLAGSYDPERFAALEASGQLRLVDGDTTVVPGIQSLLTGGHTRGHQALVIEGEEQRALYAGDLCPMTSHVRTHWHMAYDVFPLETRARKRELLGRAADQGWWVLWDHDPDVAAGHVARDEKREFRVVERRARL